MSGGQPATAIAQARVERRLQAITAVLDPVERQLWLVAVLLAGLDVALTHWGLQVGLAEGNPLVSALLAEVGIVALAGMKGALLGLAAACRWVRPRWGPWLPLGLSLPWLAAVAVNLTLLAG
jgi:hypothetical protein